MTMVKNSGKYRYDQAPPESSDGKFTVLETYSPLPCCLHPTSAVIRDNETGKIYHWNSRAHRKMRRAWPQDDSEQTTSTGRVKLWVCEPHLVSWWVVITNIISNAFWVLQGVYGLFPDISSNSTKITYAAGILAGFFLIVSCYFAYVEAINNTSCDVRLPEDDKQSKHKRKFVRPRKIYGNFKSPIGYDLHLLNKDKFRQHLIDMGFPYVEKAETKSLITPSDYDKAVTQTSSMDMTTAASHGDAPQNESPVNSSKDVEEGTATNADSSVIGKTVHIVDNNYVSTVQVLDIVRNKPTASQSYQWWTWHPATEYIGVLNGVVGFICSLVYFIPMCLAFHDMREGIELFFYDLLQGLAYTGFTIITYASVVEAAGSLWKPKLNAIGYHVCMLNLIGAIGFMLCGYFLIPGTVGASCCQNFGTGSALACLVGACSYFVGGMLQMVEFANPDEIVLCRKRKESTD